MRKIFLDCGANNGCSIDLFKEKYPLADEFNIYSFEPNPFFRQELENKNVYFYDEAVWILDGFDDFYFDNRTLGKQIDNNPIKYFGSTLIKKKIEFLRRECNLNSKKIFRVKTIDFSNFILKKFDKNDHIVLKMDIEGAEYEVLNKMIKDGSMDYIDIIYIEWHGYKYDKDGKDNTKNKELKILSEITKRNITIFSGAKDWNTVSNVINVKNK